MVAYKLPNIEMPSRGYSFDNMRLPDPFRRVSFGRAYDSIALVQQTSIANGYVIPQRESLPYLGSPERLSNRTNLN